MMACMKLRTLAVVIAVAGAAAAGGCSSAPAASHPPAASGGPAGYWTQSRLLAATPWREPGYQPGPSASAPPSMPGVRVGALFEHDASGNHFCTASVVASPGRDLLITAAHCINGAKGGGYRQDIVFIPGYRDGQAPSGIWTPAQLVVAPQWMNSSDPGFDVGFVVLKPDDGKNIEDVLGADQLGINPGYRNQVRVTGYPASAEAAVSAGAIATTASWTVESLLFLVAVPFAAGSFHAPSDSGGNKAAVWIILAVILAVGIAAALIALVPRLRRLASRKVRPHLLSIWANVKAIATEPRKIVYVLAGSTLAQLLVILALGASLHAVGQHASIATLITVNTLAAIVGGAVPVPGGLGVVEAGLIAGLAAAGIPQDQAAAAVLIQRFFTAYLPPVWGWATLAWMRRREYV